MSQTRFLKVAEEDERQEYVPEGLPDVLIGYRRLTADALREIDKKYLKTDWKRGARQQYIPDDRQRDRGMDVWDYIVLDWKNVVGKDNVQLDCTRENKWKLPGKTKADLLELADADDVSEMRGGASSPNS